MNTMTRRNFLKLINNASLTIAGAGLCGGRLAAAIEPIKRSGPAKLRLSLAAYSFRDYFKDVSYARKTQADPAKQIDMMQFVDYCADQNCEGAELTSYYFPKDVTDDYLRRVRDHAAKRGVAVSGASVGNTFTLPKGEKRDQQIADVKKWIDRAAVMGAPHIRVFAGSVQKGGNAAEATRLCIEAMEECCDYAGKKQIYLGIENHGGIVAEPESLLEIIRAVKSPWCGVNLDTGNFHSDDPYAELAKCAPYSVNVQVKVEIKRKSAKQNEPADLARIVKMLRDVNYQGFVALEYEAKEDPYTAVPRVLKEMKAVFKN
ncbi:MAG: sugar phosphate isomerase/epimerase [Verrucomicrobia bacterium]|nr:sugar phosphate isomerase/epimerase [Verrucomicrobiota bacterium]